MQLKTYNFYSQNFEDVLLARCFADQSIGFYIDVGAQHEEADSVTRYFYERGWNGINIEPVSEFAETFECRDRDKTVCCAAGSQEVTMPMSVSLASGLSSFDKVNTAKTKAMGLIAETRLIKIRTLNSILCDLGISQTSFEFLKVDVEGFELEVIKGIDLNRFRPRIILCEVTDPNTINKTSSFGQLCHEIEAFQYQYVYFDGLNQWWCATESYDELAQHFTLPPGVMDSTTLTPYSGTLARKQLSDAHNQLSDAQNQLIIAEKAMLQANKRLAALHASLSWRITSPLRNIAQLINKFGQSTGRP